MSPVSTRPTEVRPLAFSDGAPANLGRELGRGGEGVVHELPAHAEWVAKLYHQAPDAAKQQKLRLMAEAIDSPLRNYAAWPEATLHDATGGVIGFTMQRIEGRLPIHMLYSPAQRRESFPQARFDFLVFVARNIAAAFATLHGHGHVLGDVNQGNVLVGADSRVILIDCDSFQIQVGDALHRCEVGVAHFTPPELQSIASFEDITRTPNHDAFGLALLIFHLLMGGRHPYSGVPLADHIGESLEADIRDFRYAYAKDAAQRLIAPPPKSVPIDSLPPAIVALFEQAFTEPGVDARPTPQQWVGALDALRAQLQACAKNPLHLYAGHSAHCVWCSLERRRVTFFGRPAPKAARSSTMPEASAAPDLEAMEAAIAKMPTPERLTLPTLPPLRPLASIPAASAHAASSAGAVAGIAIVFGLVLGRTLPLAALVAAGLIAPLTYVVGRKVLSGSIREYEDEMARLRRLQDRVADLQDELNEAMAVDGVEAWRKAERALRAFNAKARTELAKFKLDVSENGLRNHLQRQRVEQWSDARLPLRDRVQLRAAGIETAEDFDKSTLAKLKQLGDEGRQALMQWKQDLVHQHRRQQPRQTPGLREFQQWREKQRIELEANVQAAFAKLEGGRKPGSLVLTARRNQMQSLLADLHKQHARCDLIQRRLPPSPRSDRRWS